MIKENAVKNRNRKKNERFGVVYEIQDSEIFLKFCLKKPQTTVRFYSYYFLWYLGVKLVIFYIEFTNNMRTHSDIFALNLKFKKKSGQK